MASGYQGGEIIRYCILKQPYVTEFTYESIIYKEHTPEQILDKFIHRSQSFGMITTLEMDIYVTDMIKPTPESKWYSQRDGYNEMIKAHKIINLDDICFDDYDVVITADNFLPEYIIQKYPNTLFAYFSTEHHLDAYSQSIAGGPLGGYDLFLDHFLSSSFDFQKLPATVSFPFMIDKDPIRQIINITKKADSVFLDTHLVRTIGFNMPSEIFSYDNLKKYIDEVHFTTGLDVLYAQPWDYKQSYYCVAKGEMLGTKDFLKLLSISKFFPLCRGRLAVGQALSEAAMMRNVVISDDMKYAQLICHPSCIIESTGLNLADSYVAQQKAYKIITEIKNNAGLIDEILAFQDSQLDKNFLDKPKEILEKAYMVKRELKK